MAISPDHRAWAARRLDEITDELGQISTWLYVHGSERDELPAQFAEEAGRNLLAAFGALTRAPRRQQAMPEGWLNSR